MPSRAMRSSMNAITDGIRELTGLDKSISRVDRPLVKVTDGRSGKLVWAKGFKTIAADDSTKVDECNGLPPLLFGFVPSQMLRFHYCHQPCSHFALLRIFSICRPRSASRESSTGASHLHHPSNKPYSRRVYTDMFCILC